MWVIARCPPEWSKKLYVHIGTSILFSAVRIYRRLFMVKTNTLLLLCIPIVSARYAVCYKSHEVGTTGLLAVPADATCNEQAASMHT